MLNCSMVYVTLNFTIKVATFSMTKNRRESTPPRAHLNISKSRVSILIF